MLPRCLKAVGLKSHSAVTKSLISRKNQKARLTFAEAGQRRRSPQFTFNDESKFNLLGLMGTLCSLSNWKKKKLNPKCIKKSVEGGG